MYCIGASLFKEVEMTRSLVSTIAVAISPFHAARLAMIDEEEYSGVERKVIDELGKQGIVVDQRFLEEGVLALKQYYAVALLDPWNEHAVSDTIDPFWHAHILHTRQYAEFCERVYGQFIHHNPLNRMDRTEVEHVARLYTYTAGIYSKMLNYVSGVFYPAEVPVDRLICTHYPVTNEDVRAHALFSPVELVAA
jgi:hypothetical protein